MPFTTPEALRTKSRTATIFQTPPKDIELIKGRGSEEECDSESNMDEEGADLQSTVIADNGMTETKSKIAQLLVEENYD